MKRKITLGCLACFAASISFAQATASSAKKLEEPKVIQGTQLENTDTIQQIYSINKTSPRVEKLPVRSEIKPEEKPQQPATISRLKTKPE